jgi:pheromone shutdown-related protein TraB
MNTNNIFCRPGNRDIHLIGTAHVSKESIDEVIGAIRKEQPGMVCVELDESRYAAITKQDSWEKLDITKVLKEGKGFLLIANLTLAGFQRRLGNELGVKPGEEMIAAVNTAKEMGIDFSLCDREIHLTLRRAWACCSLWSKCKLLAALLSSAFTTEKLSAQEIEKLKESSELDSMMDELANYLPAVKETLIDERDRYLAVKIWTARSKNETGSVIAVVGAGHLRGIQAWLEKFAGEEPGDIVSCGDVGLAELETIPQKTLLSKAVKWIIPVLILGIIAAGFIISFSRSDFSEFQNMLRLWVLWNGSLAALGCIIALGHPLAVLVSFLGAPITSLNPFIGVGILSGLAQAAVRKPQVSDAENISADSASLKGIYRNRITRILLVFFLSSLGSSIATFVSGAGVINSLIKIFKGD